MSTLSPQLPLGLSPRAGDRFGNFYVADDGLLVGLLQRVAEAGEERQLGLWGGHGLGKTHLLNAACHCATSAGRSALYLPLRDLLEKSPSLLNGLEAIDVVAVDDVDQLVQSTDWQRELFNLINRIHQSGHSMLTASLCNPRQLDILPDLRSRLLAGPVLQIQAPRDEQLADALCQRAGMLGLTLGDEVVRYLLTRTARDLGSLFDALDRLDRASLVEKRRLTVPFVQAVLAR